MKRETELERRKRQAANFLRQAEMVSQLPTVRDTAKALEQDGFKCTVVQDEITIHIPMDFTLKDRNKLISKLANL